MTQYTVAEPQQGKLSWLDQVVFLNGRQQFNEGALPSHFANKPEYGVVRWSEADANIAERIALREMERFGGLGFANQNKALAQALVSHMALDSCGVFSARLVITDYADLGWAWSQWAKFVYAMFAEDELDALAALFVEIQNHNCSWAAKVIPELDDWAPTWVGSDPWYDGHNVWKLAEQGPYVFDQPPPGYTGTFTPPPNEGMPPDQRPPTTEQPPGPGTQTPPETPPTTPPSTDKPPEPTTPPGPVTPPQPGTVPSTVPVAYEEKPKASLGQLLLATALGLSGIGFVAATVAMGRKSPAKPNPAKADDKLRKNLGLRPVCPDCGHDRWVYQIRPGAWTCQRHPKLLIQR